MYNARPLLIVLFLIILLLLTRYIFEENTIKEQFSKQLIYPNMFQLDFPTSQFFIYDDKKYVMDYLKLDDYVFVINSGPINGASIESQNFKLDIENTDRLKVFIEPIHSDGKKLLQFNVLCNGQLLQKINVNPKLRFIDKECINVLYSYSKNIPDILSSECKWIPNKKMKSKYECLEECIYKGQKNGCDGPDCLFRCTGCKKPDLCPWLNEKTNTVECKNHLPMGSTYKECINKCKKYTNCPTYDCEADCSICADISPNLCTWKNNCSIYSLDANRSVLDRNYLSISNLLKEKKEKNLNILKNDSK